MRKILSVFLSFLMILSLACVMPAMAEGIAINACDVADGGQGVGFFDNGKNGEVDALEYSGDNQIILRAGEWAKYDLSALSLEEGTYEVSIKRRAVATDRQRVFVDLFIDDTLCLKKNIAKNDNTFSDMVLGEVYIDDTKETVKIVNSGIYNDFYLWLESITFTYVNVDDTVTDNYEVAIHSFNILSDEKATQKDGDGAYFDVAGMTLPTGNIIDGSSYIHHAGDWSKYSVKGIPSGVYSVYFEACSRLDTQYSITVDGDSVCSNKIFAQTGGYSSSREDLAGKIYLDGNQSELKIHTTSNAIYIRGIRLKPAPLDTKLRVEAESPIPGGQNEAYYDNGTIPTRLDVLEINDGATGKTICHRTNEWVKYSISNLKPGKYSLDISSASIVEVALGVELDGEVQIEKSLLPKQTSYSDYQINRLGYLDITSRDEIIMKISHVNEAVATYIDYFELTLVEPFEVKGISSNVSPDEEIPRGADVLAVSTNNATDEKTLESVVLKTSGGKSVKCIKALSDDKKEITLSLLESLDYNTDYEIDLSELYDTFGQTLEENFVYFTTSGKADDKGESSLSDVLTKKEGNETTISGNVLSSCGLLIANREVTLKETAPSGAEIKTQTAVSDENGSFEFKVSYTEESMAGAYRYYISTDYSAEPKTIVDTHFDDELDKLISESLSGIKSSEDAKNALISNAEMLGINAEGTGLSIDMDYVYDDFVEASFNSASEITAKFSQSIAKEKINQADSADTVKAVIENREEGLLLNISYDIYDELSDSNKSAVAEKIYLSERIDSTADLITFIKKTIDAEASKALSVTNPDISVSSPEVTEGFGGTVKIGFREKAENITKIHLELSYTDGEVFENEPVTAETKLKHADLEIKSEAGKIIIDIEREYTLDDIKEICEVTFTTLDGENGEYEFSLSGYSEFVLSSGKKVKIGFANDAFGTFKVKNAQTPSGSSGSSSGSSSGGGGGASYPVISLPTATEAPSKMPIKTPAQSGDFTDLDKAEWAKESIIALKNMGIISGRGDGTFAPNDAVSRAEFVKILLGALNISAGGVSSFGDVAENDWFYTYVSKAFELGIVTGDENGNFLPFAAITRQDMATISYRLLKDTRALEIAEPVFADSDRISAYAKEAVGSLFASGMVSGVGDNLYAPEMTVSRAMAAKFAYNILYPEKKPVQTETVKENAGEREMTAEINGDKLTVITSFDEENDLVQVMSGLLADNKTSNGVINFGESKLVSKADKSQITLSSGVDECAPFNINRAYIGANHGAPYGVRIKSAHNKTIKDIGAVYKDESGIKWTILRVESADSLLLLSENVGQSETDYSFVNSVKGKLTYVSDGEDKGDINIISSSSVQLYSATRLIEKTVYAFVDGVGYKLSDGENVNCDYIDIVEKYEIINPATVAEAIRAQKPSGGYSENPDISMGKAMVKYSMTYRITPDGTVMSIFDHEIAQNIKLDFYGGIMAQERNDAFGGGVYRYIPKTSSFKAGEKEIDFTKSVNVTETDVPDLTLSQLYWENEAIAPDREISYMKNTSGEDVLAFTDGYLPIFDSEPSKRAEKVNAWGFLYPTKKHYPYYVTAKAFDSTGTKGARIKGAGYKKYEGMENDLSALGSAICVPFENDVYLYVDYKTAGIDEITLSNKLSGKTAALVEKSENVTFEQNSDVIKITVDSSKHYGYIVFKITGAGYGTGTYSKTNYSDKYTLN